MRTVLDPGPAGRDGGLVSGRMLDYIEVDETFALVRTHPPDDIVSVPVCMIRLGSRHGVRVACVKSVGEGFTYAPADTVLQYGDVILVAGSIAKAEHSAGRL